MRTSPRPECAACLREAVVDFVVPPGAKPGAGPVRVLGEGEGAVTDLLAAIGAPTVLVEAAILAWGA